MAKFKHGSKKLKLVSIIYIFFNMTNNLYAVLLEKFWFVNMSDSSSDESSDSPVVNKPIVKAPTKRINPPKQTASQETVSSTSSESESEKMTHFV